MKFEWDDAKNRRNLVKHKISFETAQSVFDDPNHLSLFDRVVDDEERWHALGLVDGVLVILVVHTLQEIDCEEAIRIISARKATSTERRCYETGAQE